MDTQLLRKLKQKFIEKVIEDFGDAYLPIKKNDFESINLTALIAAILKKNKERIPENKLKEYLVSEQTLRRIFEERDKDTTFQQATRNFLSLYIGYQNYQDFSDNADSTLIVPQKTQNWQKFVIGGVAVGLLVIIGCVWMGKVWSKPLKGKLTKVILEGDKAPITAKFSYHFNHLNFDRAILEYSLSGKRDTLELDKTKQTASVCFMHPTVRMVRLVADGQVLDSMKVIIPSDGWVSGYQEIYYLPTEQWRKNGVAHIQKDALPNVIREQPTYYSFVKKVANFDKNLSCDDMVFEARLKNPVSEGGINCNDVSVVLTGENHKFLLNLTQKGCSHFAYVRLADKKFDGKADDLGKLGVNLDEFIAIKAIFKRKRFQLFIDNQLAFESDYASSLGRLNAAYVGFKGVGTVDYIRISDSKALSENEEF